MRLRNRNNRPLFLAFPTFSSKETKLLHGLFKIDLSLRSLKDELLLDIILFYGSGDKYKETVNKEVLLHTIGFIKGPKRFERPLFEN